jgi:hypothetical protein
MFIKLTNASLPFHDKAVVLKKDIIVSIFENTIDITDTETESEVLSKEIVTTVFCGTAGTWNVKETVDEIYELL